MGVGKQPSVSAPRGPRPAVPGQGPAWTPGRWGVPGRFGPVPGGGAAPRAPVLPLGKRMAQVGRVLTIVGVLVFGGIVTDAQLSRELEAPVQVSPEVRVQPLSGWRALREDSDEVLLTRGSGNLLVAADDDAGVALPPMTVARDYVERELAPDATGGVRVAPADPVALTSGLVAQGVTYEGEFGAGDRLALVQGEVRAVVGPGGTTVVFDSWARPEVYDYTKSDVVGMTRTAEVR
jgi:hypothetical protein